RFALRARHELWDGRSAPGCGRTLDLRLPSPRSRQCLGSTLVDAQVAAPSLQQTAGDASRRSEILGANREPLADSPGDLRQVARARYPGLSHLRSRILIVGGAARSVSCSTDNGPRSSLCRSVG